MTILAVIGWGLLILSVLYQHAFSKHMALRAESLSEYIECLFQNRAVYHDHRAKYVALLREIHQSMPEATVQQLSRKSKDAIDRLAERLHRDVVISNAMGRSSVEKWVDQDSLANGLHSAST